MEPTEEQEVEHLVAQAQDRIQVDLVDPVAHQGLVPMRVELVEQEVEPTEAHLAALEVGPMVVQLVE